MKAVDSSGEVKTAEYMAGKLAEVIKDAGEENIIQCVTDNAAACVAAGRLLEAQFPHLTWTGCTSHCLDLLLEDIAKLEWAAPVIAEGKQIVNFVKNHHMPLAIFR